MEENSNAPKLPSPQELPFPLICNLNVQEMTLGTLHLFFFPGNLSPTIISENRKIPLIFFTNFFWLSLVIDSLLYCPEILLLSLAGSS